MRWDPLAVAAPLALAGCSLIYNPNNLPDPRMIDAALLDTNPCALTITDIAPTTIYEGQGTAGSRPALVVLHGNNIVNANLKVELKSSDGTTTVHLSPVTDATASVDHTYLAFTVTADVDGTLPGGTSVPLDVTVTQDAPADGSCMASASTVLPGKISLQGLNELTAVPSGAYDALYSRVALTSPAFTGTDAVAIHAVSSIAITGAVHADAAMTAPGPGGNTGAASAGACPTAGGGGDTGKDASLAALIATGGGGGGGGGATAGAPGDAGTPMGRGGAGGAGGIKSGGDAIVSLDANAACAGGAGGLGGTLVLTNPGGAGGGGGGTIALFAGGDLGVGSISAIGGDGVIPKSGGGGGGGGAGGNVLLHSDAGAVTIGGITVHGGGGSAPGGGAGAAGRARWDAPSGNPPGGTTHRGPAFAVSSSRVFSTATSAVMVVGNSGDGFSSRVIDSNGLAHDVGHTSFNNGAAVIVPTLQPGFNRLCVTLDGGMQEHPEADTCVDLALLP